MKLHYDPETDIVYIKLKSGTGVETREIVSGLNADLDASGGRWWGLISIMPRVRSI